MRNRKERAESRAPHRVMPADAARWIGETICIGILWLAMLAIGDEP